MNISKKTLFAGIAVTAIAGASAVGFANHRNGDHRDNDSASLIQEVSISLDQAVEIALADVPGISGDSILNKTQALTMNLGSARFIQLQ